MRVVCPGCSTGYRVADEKVSGDGARIKCPRCGTVFIARKQKETKSEEQKESGACAPSSAAGVASAKTAIGGDKMAAEQVQKIQQQPSHEQATNLRQLLGLDVEEESCAKTGRHSTDTVEPPGAGPAPAGTPGAGVTVEGAAGHPRGVSAIRAQSSAAARDVFKSYRVKTPRGLTYDFSSREAMLRWLSKRDDIDQCEVAEPEGEWIPAGSLLDSHQPVSATGEILAHSPGNPVLAGRETDVAAGSVSGQSMLVPERLQGEGTAVLWGVNLLLAVLLVSAVAISLTRYGVVDLSSLPPASWLEIKFPGRTAGSDGVAAVASNPDRVYL
ncbi:MAG: hypothetical protein D6806_17360, partial [Deltaproteobacteria bacterium]